MRELYQISQIQRLRKHQSIVEEQKILRQWQHAYQVSQRHRYDGELPTQLDQNAFVTHILYCLFDIDIKFKVSSLTVFREHLYRQEINYDPIRLQELAEKHKIEIQKVRYDHLDDLQFEVFYSHHEKF